VDDQKKKKKIIERRSETRQMPLVLNWARQKVNTDKLIAARDGVPVTVDQLY
jgi:hypothetical protein